MKPFSFHDEPLAPLLTTLCFQCEKAMIKRAQHIQSKFTFKMAECNPLHRVCVHGPMIGAP